jgi:hypothetical protein
MKRLIVPLMFPLLAAALGCQATKSSNPLSPTVAGPIPGVAITAPNPIDPSGAKVAATSQPVTLVAENGATTGVRPLTYLFEVATDTGFTNKVFVRDGVAPSDTGRTSLQLPDPLQSGRTYYWRTQAHDGANSSAYSGAAHFDVFTPVAIGPPTLVSPINVADVSTLHPTFVIGNSPRSGPVGAISYVIELRCVREQVGHLDGCRAGQSDEPDRAPGSGRRTDVLLARACGRSDDDRTVVGDAGIQDAGTGGDCRTAAPAARRWWWWWRQRRLVPRPAPGGRRRHAALAAAAQPVGQCGQSGSAVGSHRRGAGEPGGGTGHLLQPQQYVLHVPPAAGAAENRQSVGLQLPSRRVQRSVGEDRQLSLGRRDERRQPAGLPVPGAERRVRP